MVKYWLRMVQYWTSDGEVLAPGWCSTGLWMGKFWSGNYAGKVGNNLEKIKQKACCIDTIVACQKF
jgi:hypothetical protein